MSDNLPEPDNESQDNESQDSDSTDNRPTDDKNQTSTHPDSKAAAKENPLQDEQKASEKTISPQQKHLSTTIDLLRHGKVATPSLFSAPVDEPLGMEGWKQLTVATQDTQWDVIITPPTRRCHDYARLLSQRLECEFIVDQRYCELDFGDWIGLSQKEILERDPDLLQQFYFQPRRFRAPNGESMDEFTWRIQAAWEELLVQQAGKKVLILTQTGVIRMILARALDLLYQKTLRFDVGYARFTRLERYPDGEIVLSGHGLSSVAGF